MKDVWRFAGMSSGAPFVMITGRALMPKWLAGSWDILPQVIRHLFDTTGRLEHFVLLFCRFHRIYLCPLWPGNWPHSPG